MEKALTDKIQEMSILKSRKYMLSRIIWGSFISSHTKRKKKKSFIREVGFPISFSYHEKGRK